jgi:hypothetical protein
LPVIALLGVLLTACPDDGSGRRAEPESDVSPTSRPTAGEPITFGVLGEPATLDPYAAGASDLTRYIARALYPSLFALPPDGAAEPLLAAGIDVDGRRATVRLVSTAGWSDGEPVTATDVVASWRRARGTDGPSGFRDIRSASALDPTTVVFRGRVEDWEATLARAAYVLPAKGGAKTTAGPFRIAGRTPGLEVVLEPDPLWFGERTATVTIRVQFIRTTGTMLALLERGRLDAAAMPSMVNLTERAEAGDLEADSAFGWETVRLGFGSALSRSERAGLVRILDLDVIEETLIRDDGERATTLHPGPEGSRGPYRAVSEGAPPAGEVTVTGPAGDELLTLFLRAIYAQLDRAGVGAEASPIDPFTFYGEWLRDDPSDVSIRRAAGAPGTDVPPDDPTTLDHFPLFRVATYILWRPGLRGLQANPTLDGPLWNAHDWKRAGVS